MTLLTRDNFEELKKSGKGIQEMHDLIEANAELVKNETTRKSPLIIEKILTNGENICRFFFGNKGLYFVEAYNYQDNWGYAVMRHSDDPAKSQAAIEFYRPQEAHKPK